MSYLGLPEIAQSHSAVSLLRIPPELDVPVTPRVLALIDTPAMRRLSRISQLGLVNLVYPGANHTRLEHSLGVFRNAIQVLDHLAQDEEFVALTGEMEAKLFLVSALLHDVGHWPMCHAIEDMQLPHVPRHEDLARQLITTGDLADALRQQWEIDPHDVAAIISGDSSGARWPLLRGLLSGPVDIDKLDYLQRDSLHAGVPYGRNFDTRRLIGSLCIGPNRREIAITEKGKTAAEMMVFSRYVMFSEVYWHHAVRSATAMFQRLVFALAATANPSEWLKLSDAQMAEQLLLRAQSDPGLLSLAEGLFGSQRKLYKRLLQFSYVENAAAHGMLARRPYSELVLIAARLAERLSRQLASPLRPTDVLIDAPPVKLEVQFQLPVKNQGGTPSFQQLGDMSPVVQALATRQFDDYVKRVRVFVHPDRRHEIQLEPLALTHELLAAVCD